LVRTATPTKSAKAAEVAEECDASLRRLGVDAIDVFSSTGPRCRIGSRHRRLREAPPPEIRAIGVSELFQPQFQEWCATGVPLH
jgi:diketogulonate reductase-like aldo/keto reductase